MSRDILWCMEHAGTSVDDGPGGHAARRVTDERMTDEVDDLVAAWQAERPDLDVRPMQVLSRISRVDAARAALLPAEQALLAGLPETSRHTLAGLLRVLLVPLDAG